MNIRLVRPFVLLEDRSGASGVARLFTRLVERVSCHDPEALPAALERIQAGLDRGLCAAGFLSYEAGRALEPRLGVLPNPAPQAELLCFGLFDGFEPLAGEDLDRMFGALAPPPPLRDVVAGHSRAQHVAKVRAVIDLIEAGEVYQVNLTFPIRFGYDGDPLALYAALRARQPVAHGGVLALGRETALSVSPEMFLSIADGHVTTRPMKGTAPRGADAAADDEARERLAADPKQRAENLMIVDLLRNDLSRICEIGSVRVPALRTVETYPTFHALTSTVTGKLRAGASLREILAAMFPCGSVVGAPKIRAGEIIAALEGAAEGRGVYTGAFGAIDPDGSWRFSVGIRTVILGRGVGRFGVGGGIVAESDPDAEYDEALLKGRVLTDLATEYQLIETLRWTSAGGLIRGAHHLSRLAGSARLLGFAIDLEDVARRLDAASAAWRGGADRRVRLLLYRDGTLKISATEIAAEPNRLLNLAVFDQVLDGADPFLRHKTTRRAQYDAAAAKAAELGLDEMIFLNRRGELADGSRNNIFIEHAGRLLTPPVRAGALPGILRGHLLTTGAATEATLAIGDLRDRRLFIGNSLRGLRAAHLNL